MSVRKYDLDKKTPKTITWPPHYSIQNSLSRLDSSKPVPLFYSGMEAKGWKAREWTNIEHLSCLEQQVKTGKLRI